MTITKDWKTIIGFIFFFAAGALFVLALTTRSGSGSTGTPASADGPLLAQCAPTGSTTTPTSTAGATPALAAVAAPSRLIGAGESSSGSNNDILAVSGSQNTTQGTDGGFGDIGMQFQNVTLDAPITNVHISDEGSGNQTSINVGGTNSVSAIQGPGSTMTPPQQSSTAPSSGQTSPTATGAGSSPGAPSQAPSANGSSTSAPSSDTGTNNPTQTGSTSTSTSASGSTSSAAASSAQTAPGGAAATN